MRRWGWIALAGAALGTLFAWHLLGLQFADVSRGLHNAGQFFHEAFPPDWSVWERGLLGLRETVLIAYLATVMGLVLSLPLAVLAARNLTPDYIGAPIRTVLAAIRVMPSVLWALLVVIMIGIGPLAGVVAMAFYTLGFLGKLQYEAIEGLPAISLETASAMGLSPLQRIRHVVVPESANTLISQVLFMFEYNVRASAIIGIVGAGGIGWSINLALSFHQYDRVLAYLLMIFGAVVLIDWASGRLRRRFTEPGTPMRRARWRDLLRPMPAGATK
jgi:phosphonate transport system permease protein